MNLAFSHINWVANHPNWRSYFSEGWPNHQPVFVYGCFLKQGEPQMIIAGWCTMEKSHVKNGCWLGVAPKPRKPPWIYVLTMKKFSWSSSQGCSNSLLPKCPLCLWGVGATRYFLAAGRVVYHMERTLDPWLLPFDSTLSSLNDGYIHMYIYILFVCIYILCIYILCIYIYYVYIYIWSLILQPSIHDTDTLG